MLDKYIELKKISPKLKKGLDDVRQGIPLAVFGVSLFAKCHFVSSIDAPVVYLLKDRVSIMQVKEELEGITNKKVVYLPAKDEVLITGRAEIKERVFERICALKEIENGGEILLTTVDALMQFIPSKIESFTLKEGKEYDLESILTKLVKMGYERSEFAESKGTFARRGDILDLFPINEENPLRIDFFGDEVESIKVIEDSKKSAIRVKQIEILTATDGIVYDQEDFISKIKEELKKLNKREKVSKLKDSLSALLEKENFFVKGEFLPLLSRGSIFDYLKDAVIVYDEPKQIKDMLSLIETEHIGRFENLYKEGEVFSFTKNQLVNSETIFESINKRPVVSLSTITTKGFFNPLSIISVNTSPVPKYRLKTDELMSDLFNWISSGYTVILTAGNEKQKENLAKDLLLNKIPYKETCEQIHFGKVNLILNNLRSGGIYHDDKIVVVASGDVFLTEEKKTLKKRKNEVFFSAPEVGDFAVHETHGIGRVTGISTISSTESTKDYISILYEGGDLLYIPVERLDLLTKYIGGESEPKLSRIGGSSFEKTLERVKASIRKMSFDLKELYDKRNKNIGYVFVKDKEMVDLFASSFKHQLTVDQTEALIDIEKDMCSNKVMDRLICGDVGFGKTEVAFRASFLAILNHKQVALIAPTTVLTEQHFKTAIERFADFGVNIAVLNRFKSKKEQTDIIKKIKEGKIDFIIGTHRLFSKDVEFKDLGLLILDEEQRFGVEHKEKIKTAKIGVDTLSLSATPIPRTLNFSLTGIRDISVINTPPKERLPVQTYVIEESDGIIKDAINREVGRGGQVFVLYNRVETIEVFAGKMNALFPDYTIKIAHGRMKETLLEKNILEFSEKKADILISTTIIENGIDIPSVNTIIVIDSDRLGLSTLYQLKGRVGRGNRLAHAYFTFKADKVISETAYKRLNAIMEFVKMGSGFKIAMRDLEIRGAGTVLGREQHGHMEKVGYELYSKLLKEELKENSVIEKEVELDIRVSAYIPTGYIERSSTRMDVYKKIAEITDDELEVRNELKEVFGKMPKEVDNLIRISVVKNMAKKIFASEVIVNKEEISIVFEDINALNNKKLLDEVEKNSQIVSVVMDKKPKLTFKNLFYNNEKSLWLVYDFLKRVI